jgi:hypothetical protein
MKKIGIFSILIVAIIATITFIYWRTSVERLDHIIRTAQDERVALAALYTLIEHPKGLNFLQSKKDDLDKESSYYIFMVAKGLIILGDEDGILFMATVLKKERDGLLAEEAFHELHDYIIYPENSPEIRFTPDIIDRLEWLPEEKKFQYIQ